MPRLRRSAAMGRALSRDEYRTVLTGMDFFDSLTDPQDFEAAWWSVRDELLPEYILLCPTTRPEGWWRCEAPEKIRRCVSGPGNSAFRDYTLPEWTRGLSFGLPTCTGYDDWQNPSGYEQQVEYLNRHNLLEQSEVDWLDALAASDDPTYREPEFCFREWWERRRREAAL